MKISTARLKQIIREELFYREFHRTTEEITEVHSEKQRNYMCAMKDSDDRPDGLSKAEAEEMCTGPMKEYGDAAYSRATQLLDRTPFAAYHGLRNAIASALRQGKRISPNDVARAMQGTRSPDIVSQRLGI